MAPLTRPSGTLSHGGEKATPQSPYCDRDLDMPADVWADFALVPIAQLFDQ
jgi:hypothetical protein